jgi:drug/metabolite transporter (DMT)-like permease
VLVALGAPLLAFGMVILLGAVVRLVTGSFTLPVSTYLAAIVFGGVLPTALGIFLIYKGIKKDQ